MMLRRILLSLGSALLGVLVFEPFGWWPLVLVAWIPLLWSIRGMSPRVGFYLGFFHGLVLFGITLSWMWNIFAVVSVALWAMLAFFTGIACLVMAKLPERSALQTAFLMAMVWTGVEYFRAEVFSLTFPWITAGTGLPPNQLTPFVGVYGVTFLVIFGGALVLRSWREGGLLLVFVGVAVIFVPEASKSIAPIRVGLVQDEGAGREKLARASQGFLDAVDAVLWPEYAFEEIDDEAIELGKEMAGDDRIFVASGMETRGGVVGNTAITVSRDGVVGRHIKNHPVHFFSDGVAGTTAGMVETGLGKVGTPICFDCDHQDVIRKMTRSGAEFFLIPSMDAEHWSARQHEQHGMLFRHRAAENGRWLAVASSSGVTQIIDAAGEVRKRLPLMEAGTLVGEISPMNERTFFQRGGWLIGPSSMFGSGLAILWMLGQNFRKSS